jgi:CheY-like chemotaxis protein
MKSITILLVEDNEGDIVLTKEAFEDSKLINKMQILRDGKQAIRFFETLDDTAEKPDLVLLDINLPKISGHEVLKYIKTHEKHKSIPVIMLTTSSSEKDISQSYTNNVNCYITKPIDTGDFNRAMSKIEDFWINVVSVPGK